MKSYKKFFNGLMVFDHLNLNKSETSICFSWWDAIGSTHHITSLWFIVPGRENERGAKLNLIKSGSTARLLQKHGFGGPY